MWQWIRCIFAKSLLLKDLCIFPVRDVKWLHGDWTEAGAVPMSSLLVMRGAHATPASVREATADLQSNKDLEAVLDSELDMLVSQGFAEVQVLVSISNEQEEPENSAIRYCDKRAQKIASGLQWWEASATHAAVLGTHLRLR